MTSRLSRSIKIAVLTRPGKIGDFLLPRLGHMWGQMRWATSTTPTLPTSGAGTGDTGFTKMNGSFPWKRADGWSTTPSMVLTMTLPWFLPLGLGGCITRPIKLLWRRSSSYKQILTCCSKIEIRIIECHVARRLTHFNRSSLSGPRQLWVAAKALSKPIWVLSGFYLNHQILVQV